MSTNDTVTGVGSVTSNGTKIIPKSQSGALGEDAFLKILIAELSHQDPTSNQDSTQYVAQLAEFSSLQEITDLNKTMEYSAATSTMGKTITLDENDTSGNPYRGTVEKVTKDGDDIKLYVQLMDSNDNPVKQEALDSEGNVIKDANGNVEYLTKQVAKTDSSGNVVKDADGNIEYEQVYIPKVEEFDYSDISSVLNGNDDVDDTEQSQIDSSSSSST